MFKARQYRVRLFIKVVHGLVSIPFGSFSDVHKLLKHVDFSYAVFEKA